MAFDFEHNNSENKETASFENTSSGNAPLSFPSLPNPTVSRTEEQPAPTRPGNAPLLTPNTFEPSRFPSGSPFAPKPDLSSPGAFATESVLKDDESKDTKKKKRVKKASSEGRSHKGKMALVATVFCMLGIVLTASGAIVYGTYWSKQLKKDAVSAAKKAAQKEIAASIEEAEESRKSVNVREGQHDAVTINTLNVDTSERHTAAEIYAAYVNSTVAIYTSADYYYNGYSGYEEAAGSGFVYSDDGYIVTNLHVVDGADTIKIYTYDEQLYDAKLVGYDTENDLAVLKVDDVDMDPVVIGDSDQLHVGDDVLAIGNPLGELPFTLTSGCVSALNRPVEIDDLNMVLIQTDCTINAGNSGGALFNMYGEVIGITNAKYSNNGEYEAAIENIGFAIPISDVRVIIDSIIEKGYYSRPYIGVYVETITPDMDYSVDAGIGIHNLFDNGTAKKAGVKSGDAIVKINGEEVTKVEELREYLDEIGIGGTLTLTINRNGKEIEIEVEIDELITSDIG
ncbi:MAG: trypsin-like peptidase domain-containing protein [Clostridiales bacterium]|nr:trypsin-like peptidase domain-containing protein [Clostridiales bacterium]